MVSNSNALASPADGRMIGEALLLVHLVNFQILDRNGQSPHAHERSWKDTLRLESGDDVRVIMRFDGYRGRYLMHCHNLEHEDYDLMMRFDVV